MIITRFKAVHLDALQLQDAQSYFSSQIAMPGYARHLEEVGGGFTGMIDGCVVACAGCAEVWKGRAVAWALLSKDASKHMMTLHRAVNGYLKATPFHRIEAWVDEGFEPGERWLQMMGFKRETPEPMQGFRPDGGACFLYSKVK